MTPQIGFLAFLLITVFLLGAVLLTGFARRIPAHLTLVALALLSLGTAIFYAKQLGGLYDLQAAGPITPIHLFLAKLTTALYILPLLSGALTLRDRRHLPLHKNLAFLVVAMTLISTVTGALMLYWAVPI